MKTGVSLVVLTFWLVLANSLKCHKCLNRQGNCSETEVEVCKPGQDSCFFEIKRFTGLNADTAKQGCGRSNYCRHYPGGFRGFLFRRMHCCSTDLCLPVTYHASSEGSKNGVECQSCIGNATECGQNAPSEPCIGTQDTCVQISQRFLPGEGLEPIIKGCGNDSFKDVQVVYQIGNNFAYVDQKVCKGSNCNNRTYSVIPAGDPNGLQCYTCQDTGLGECTRDKLQLLNCTGVMDRCVHVRNQENRSVTIQKGCGTQTMCTAYLEIYHPLIWMDSFAECCKTSFCNRAAGPSAPERLPGMVALALLLARMAWK
ncbi:urokinase plasminogen activator surface receptor-like [Eublepharis macularius]|uniref:Urokinase plasminogen activator surface receptor-like n=1 Tax=Eublepharis macularius TaxID=481883 RepID=A0AA97LL31_EUBMA|nr:urokinase plasminogen activator surface receptor-like [Eublepharis macularius]XP_054855752.1 urokinase plasminogen activator surface receptor-like [Eublepharis macularius]